MSVPSLERLLDWWTADLSPAESEQIEESIFSDDDALADAEWVVQLGHAIARATAGGGIPYASVTSVVSHQLENAGIPHTRYVVQPGETVQCAATEDQRFSVVHLRADLEGIERVDVRLKSPHIGEMNVEDVAINWRDGEVALLQAGDAVRALPSTTLAFELVGRRGEQVQVLGRYVLEHTALADQS